MDSLAEPGPQDRRILPQSTSAQRPSLVLQPQIYIEHQIRHAPLSRGKRSRHLVWVLSRHSQTVRQPQIHLVTANFSAQKKCQFIVLLSGVYTDVQYTPDERESLSTGEIHFLSTFYSHHQLAYIVEEDYGESESFALVTLSLVKRLLTLLFTQFNFPCNLSLVTLFQFNYLGFRGVIVYKLV